jgi:hypothetical protein
MCCDEGTASEKVLTDQSEDGVGRGISTGHARFQQFGAPVIATSAHARAAS